MKTKFFVVAAALATFGGAARAIDVYAFTVQGDLIRFDSATPGTTSTVGSVAGAGSPS